MNDPINQPTWQDLFGSYQGLPAESVSEEDES